MRISTIGAFQRGVSLMQQLQAALDRTQQQISSGRRILSPSDDPIASSRTIELRETLSRLEQFDRNANIARNRLGYEESALSNASNVLQRVRELALQANNATQSDETRHLIAVEIREHLDQLVQLANQQDGNGRYLFSGNADDTAPVTQNAGNFSYNGDQSQRFIQIGGARRVADGDSGADVFFRIRNGNGTFATSAAAANTGSGVLGAGSVVDPTAFDMGQYTVRFIDAANYEVLDSTATVIAGGSFQSGEGIAFRGIVFSIDGAPQAGDEFYVDPSRLQDVFLTIQNLAEAIDSTIGDSASQALLNNSINAGLLDIDQAIGKLLDIRTQVGSRLAAIDTQEETNGQSALIVQQTISEIEDLDYAAAISRLGLQATTLEAAQKAFLQTQSLSLFRFL